MAVVQKKRKKKKIKLSPAEREQKKLKNDHFRLIRNVFRETGFYRLTSLSDREFTFDGQKTDFDDIFVFENVVVCAEYTITKGSEIGHHLKIKKIVYDKILASPFSFISFLKKQFPLVADLIAPHYHHTQIILKVLYCSRFDFDENHKINVPGPVYMDYPIARYFASVTHAIKKSARFELFEFMDIEHKRLGSNGKVSSVSNGQDYSGSILPEAHSNFPDGYKVVSFYADPQAILQRAYVLRRDGWADSDNLYQRMISSTKIASLRDHLKTEERVFVNNIIVTLPSDVRPIDAEQKTIDTKELTSTAAVSIRLPNRANSVGIIDGQHRVFAYHETNDDDAKIARLRMQQNLLVTGVIYPKNISSDDREKFEAKLFLEINSTQTNAKSNLKQAIGLVLDPFANNSIAMRVLNGLARKGALAGHIEQFFFDKGKLKTSSIVSYALRPLVKISGNDSLYFLWSNSRKDELLQKADVDLLREYIDFCISMINVLLGSIRENLDDYRWTTNVKVDKCVLTTTYVNAFLILLRILIENNVLIDFKHLSKKFVGINDFDFSAYRSSQYSRMADEIFRLYID